MTTAKNIYTLLPEAIGAIAAVGKTEKNTAQNYAFRGIDNIMNEVKPAFAKLGITVTPELLKLTREDRKTPNDKPVISSIVEVRYTFFAPDGSSISVVTPGEGFDSGDKSVNKAMTSAFKNALVQTLCIATHDQPDSEFESPEVSEKVLPKHVFNKVNYNTGEVTGIVTQADMKELTLFAKKHDWDSTRLQDYCLSLDGVDKTDFFGTFTQKMMAETKAYIIEASANEAFTLAVK